MCEKRKAVAEDLAAGKEVPMCNFCRSCNNLMEAGANLTEVPTGFGSVTLITFDKPEAVEMTHRHVKQTQDEHERMMAMAQQ